MLMRCFTQTTVLVSLLCNFFSLALADEGALDALGKNFIATEAEKTFLKANPEAKFADLSILIEGKRFQKTFVVFQLEGQEKGIYWKKPTDEKSSVLRRVYLHLESGGVYVSEPDSQGPTRFLKLTKEKEPDAVQKAEAMFIRQFAHYLQQRHPEDSYTKKYFENYFRVVEKSITKDVPVPVESLLIPGLKESFAEGTATSTPSLPQVFSLMSQPSTWTGLECNEEFCIYKHEEKGTIAVAHPGVADLLFTEEELVTPSDTEPAYAPEVSDKNDVERILAEASSEVDQVFILVTHENCPPCNELKRADGMWSNLVRKITKGKLRKILAACENCRVTTPQGLGQANLIREFSLPGQYPQLLIFERSDTGGWKEPRRLMGEELRKALK